MYSEEILDLVMKQGGILTLRQYIDIYDNSPQIQCVFWNDGEKYEFEMICYDKEESILFNVVNDIIK